MHVGGQAVLEENADATDSTTGGLVVMGGTAVQQTLWAGSNVHVDGISHLRQPRDSTEIGVGALVIGRRLRDQNITTKTLHSTDLTNAGDTNVASFIIDGGLRWAWTWSSAEILRSRAHSSTT